MANNTAIHSDAGTQLKDEERQRVGCYSRVMGYFRPVYDTDGEPLWNKGKRQEFRDRVYFTEKTAMRKQVAAE